MLILLIGYGLLIGMIWYNLGLKHGREDKSKPQLRPNNQPPGDNL